MDGRAVPMSEIRYFLLVFDRSAGVLTSVSEFDDAGSAGTAYEHAERENFGQTRFETVLVGADSIETLKHTHGHYFSEASAVDSLFEMAARN